jgi:DNA-binding response OmpR family regulator
VSVAGSVRAALDIDIGTVDLLLSDMGLGDATGLDLMQQLRKKSSIKGIVLSGFGTEADVRASRDAGFSRHLVKPVSFELLFEAIAAVTAEP